MYVLEVKNTRQWKTTLIFKSASNERNFPEGTPDNGLDGGASPKGIFFWIYVYEKVGISLVGA